MQNGRLVEEGSTGGIFNEPTDAYTKRLVNARNLERKRRKRNKSLEILKLNSLSAQYEQNKLFRKSKVNKVINNINLSINLGETIGLVGESGSGKTTIGLSILRLIKSEGSIVFMGDDIAKKSFKALKRIRKDLQIVFQDPFGSLSPRLTVEQIIEEGLIAQKIELDVNRRRERVLEILQDVGLARDQLNRYPHEFSGGQRQRIAIARAIILRPKLLVLDEPTSSLDATVQLQILNLLKELQDKFNTSYIFISHDLRVIRYVADRVMVLNSGEIIEMDYTENIFNNPRNDYTKKLISSALLG
jgi:microcin C transport system ATP-binding protein